MDSFFTQLLLKLLNDDRVAKKLQQILNNQPIPILPKESINRDIINRQQNEKTEFDKIIKDKLAEINDLKIQNASLSNQIQKLNQAVSNKESDLFRKHQELYKNLLKNSDLGYKHLAKDLETFILTTSSQEFLKEYRQKLATDYGLDKPLPTQIHNIFILCIESVAKAKNTGFEIFEPHQGDIYNSDKHNSPKGSGRKIAELILPGYKFSSDKESVKPLVRTEK